MYLFIVSRRTSRQILPFPHPPHPPHPRPGRNAADARAGDENSLWAGLP
ncbi:hypothetical protein Thpro_021686 [Acidihalobacter prosperus]|uniref:Uncharacterized protein n=1 Tax=Acidihalobacter prosperus TaxID=160660 RepID=A0A1A6C470_9GAMM|nr:hypothetical protein Thpro_021686 [Acidihalobacter prosperus]